PPPARSLAARDRYPSTTFGVMAHFRQTLLDAQWYAQMRDFVCKHPDARGDLPYDRDLEDLQDVLAGRMPVIWEADGFDEIHRALDLAEEFKLRIAIVGGRDAFRLADRLKKTNVPVVLTLVMPKKPDEFKFDTARWLKDGTDQKRSGGS